MYLASFVTCLWTFKCLLLDVIERICYFSQANKVNWLNYVKTHYVRFIHHFFISLRILLIFLIIASERSPRGLTIFFLLFFLLQICIFSLKRLSCTFDKAIDIHYVVLTHFNFKYQVEHINWKQKWRRKSIL